MATTTWKQGTITLTNGSATVTGDGTDWDVAELEGGETLAVVTDPPIDFSMTIQAVVGAEEITLTAPWAGATLIGVPYQITRDYTGAPADAPIPQRGDMNPWAIIGEAFRRLNNAIASFSPAWGDITGTLSDQTDLQNALDAKADASSALPSGGTTGQLLAKATNDDFDVEWTDGASSPAWGDITGTLSDQTDLQNALNAKLEGVDWGDIGGTLSNQTDLQNTRLATITFVIDGGGSAISTGVKGDLEIPFGCTIEAVTLLADQSGSIVVDIWKDTYANYPPTDADSITASAVPTISAATKSTDATLTGWTTAISAGDILRFNVDSAATVQRLTISLTVRKS